ncbi:unnamed protein product [Gadus morhua 'NCC']
MFFSCVEPSNQRCDQCGAGRSRDHGETGQWRVLPLPSSGSECRRQRPCFLITAKRNHNAGPLTERAQPPPG